MAKLDEKLKSYNFRRNISYNHNVKDCLFDSIVSNHQQIYK